MFDDSGPGAAAFVTFAVLIIAGVSLTAGYTTSVLVHRSDMTFNQRWPVQQIADADPAVRQAIVERFRG